MAPNIKNAIVARAADIEQVVSECSLEIISGLPQFQQAIQMAEGIKRLRSALDDSLMESVFMPLQGSPLGFRTDKDTGGGYRIETVREAVIETLIRGFRITGNEMNIIGGRAYFTKEGFERKVYQFPGIGNLDLIPGVPDIRDRDKSAFVAFHAHWTLNGERSSLICDIVKVDGLDHDRRIPVRMNAGMTADAILGKAHRKMYARIYQRLSGVIVPDGDLDGELPVTRVAVDVAPEMATQKPTIDITDFLRGLHAAEEQDQIEAITARVKAVWRELTPEQADELRRVKADAEARVRVPQ